MTDAQLLKIAISRIESLENSQKYTRELILKAQGKANNGSQAIFKFIDLLLPFLPLVAKTTDYINTEGSAITEINTTALNYDIKVGDKLKIINFQTGNYFEVEVNADASAGAESITIVSIIPTEVFNINSLILFSMVRDADHKIEIEH